MKNYNHPSS